MASKLNMFDLWGRNLKCVYLDVVGELSKLCNTTWTFFFSLWYSFPSITTEFSVFTIQSVIYCFLVSHVRAQCSHRIMGKGWRSSPI